MSSASSMLKEKTSWKKDKKGKIAQQKEKENNNNSFYEFYVFLFSSCMRLKKIG